MDASDNGLAKPARGGNASQNETSPAPASSPTDAHPPRNRMWIAGLSLAGAFLAFYLVAYNLGWTGLAQCGTGECATVQASRYAWVGPVPVSAVGLGGYLALLALSLLGLQPAFERSRTVAALLFGGALFGVAFSAYLTYLEAVVIRAWCQYCVASAVLVAIVFLAALPEFKRMKGNP